MFGILSVLVFIWLLCFGRGAGVAFFWAVLGGSWDLVSKVISTLIGVISSCK